jgi:hypothetical protein
MCMSINKSYFSTGGLTVSCLQWNCLNKLPVYGRDLLNTAQSKTSHSKVERNWTHVNHCLWKLKMHVHVLLWLDLMFQRSIIRSGTHTVPLIQRLWLTQPPERKTSQHATLSQPLWTVHQHKAVFCSYYKERSILLKADACSLVVQICDHKCPLEVEMTQDITVKKGMWMCSVVHQLSEPSVSLYVM